MENPLSPVRTPAAEPLLLPKLLNSDTGISWGFFFFPSILFLISPQKTRQNVPFGAQLSLINSVFHQILGYYCAAASPRKTHIPCLCS